MILRRHNDKVDQPPMMAAFNRQERVYKENNQWFFRCRDNSDVGPFADKQNAYWALARYIRKRA